MRIAIVSDIHGNRTAFDAVLKDLRDAAPDLILHGGDLADAGSSPAEIVDHIRDLGWKGVLGNTDEAHTRPESLEEFASKSKAPPSLWAAIRAMTAATRAMLGEDRIAWLRELPLVHVEPPLALVHGSPNTAWRSPGPEANDSELQSIYGSLEQRVVVYGHIHRSFIRNLTTTTVVNSGSVSLSYDGDPRAAYVLVDDGQPSIRRVEYDVEKEVRALAQSGIPHADWIARTLRAASPQMA